MTRLLLTTLGLLACATQTTDPTTAPRTGPTASPLRGPTITPAGIQFRVWAPNATAAWVEGDFPEQKVAMTPGGGGDGTFAATVAGAHAGSLYWFDLDAPSGALRRIDPYCRQVLADGSACVVVDPTAYAWKTPTFTRPARAATVVYELHVASFTAGGTFASTAAAMPTVADLGANVVELMPVQSFGGKLGGWGYNPQLYFAPKAGYGTADDLRALVDAAHGAGVGVWIDTVVNHCDRWTQAPLACFDGNCPAPSNGIYFFPPGTYEMTPWGPRLSYPDAHVSEMLRATVPWWLGEMHGDGFRWDSVSNIRAIDGSGTVPGGRDLLVAANNLAHASGAMSVAEDLKGYAAITQSSASGGFGFDAQWDGFGYAVTGVLTQGSDDARDLGAIQGALTGNYGGDPFARLIFIEDHDTVGNGGARLPSLIDPVTPTGIFARRRSMLGGVLLLSSPGVPMLFMGEESLATGTFTNPPAQLASTIPAPYGTAMRAFYKDMIALRRNLGGLSGGLLDASVDVLQRNDVAKVIAYRRYGASGHDVLVIVNLRNAAYTQYDFGVPSGGAWRVRLDTDWTTYGSDFGGGQTGPITATATPKDGQPFTLSVKLAPYGAVVLSR